MTSLNSSVAGDGDPATERATWAIRLPLDKPLSLNDRQHWAVKAKATRQLRSDTLTLVLAAKIPPHQRIAVGLVWTPKDRRRRDWDNPIPTLKACCDALVDARVVPDDTHEFMDKSMPEIAEPDGDPPADPHRAGADLMPPFRPLYERIDAKIEVAAETDCWLWLGCKNTGGYGQVRVSTAIGSKLVHRLQYERYVGTVPGGFDLDHLCRVRHCCNLAHLEPVTRRENALRGVSPKILIHLSGLCHRGHPLVWVANQNRNECPTCVRFRRQRHAAQIAPIGHDPVDRDLHAHIVAMREVAK